MKARMLTGILYLAGVVAGVVDAKLVVHDGLQEKPKYRAPLVTNHEHCVEDFAHVEVEDDDGKPVMAGIDLCIEPMPDVNVNRMPVFARFSERAKIEEKDAVWERRKP